MSTLPVTPPQKQPSVFTGLRQQLVLGGLFGGGSILFAVVEVLKSEPDKGFNLLLHWGPWAFFAMLCVWALNGWVVFVLKAGERIFGGAAERLVGSLDRIAAAQQQAADKDDRQMQELQTLTAYASQESERNSTALRHIAEMQAENAEAIKKILQAIESRPQIDINQVVAQAVTEYKRAESPPAQGVTR